LAAGYAVYSTVVNMPSQEEMERGSDGNGEMIEVDLILSFSDGIRPVILFLLLYLTANVGNGKTRMSSEKEGLSHQQQLD
jgi:hypothetical protein